MKALPTPQEQMAAAIDNYFSLSDVLREDLLALLETESDSQHWRRNYVRVSSSLIEGYPAFVQVLMGMFTKPEPPKNSPDQSVQAPASAATTASPAMQLASNSSNLNGKLEELKQLSEAGLISKDVYLERQRKLLEVGQ